MDDRPGRSDFSQQPDDWSSDEEDDEETNNVINNIDEAQVLPVATSQHRRQLADTAAGVAGSGSWGENDNNDDHKVIFILTAVHFFLVHAAFFLVCIFPEGNTSTGLIALNLILTIIDHQYGRGFSLTSIHRFRGQSLFYAYLVALAFSFTISKHFVTIEVENLVAIDGSSSEVTAAEMNRRIENAITNWCDREYYVFFCLLQATTIWIEEYGRTPSQFTYINTALLNLNFVAAIWLQCIFNSYLNAELNLYVLKNLIVTLAIAYFLCQLAARSKGIFAQLKADWHTAAKRVVFDVLTFALTFLLIVYLTKVRWSSENILHKQTSLRTLINHELTLKALDGHNQQLLATCHTSLRRFETFNDLPPESATPKIRYSTLKLYEDVMSEITEAVGNINLAIYNLENEKDMHVYDYYLTTKWTSRVKGSKIQLMELMVEIVKKKPPSIEQH